MPIVNKPLAPIGYPASPGLEHPWNYDANLSYSSDWLDKGSYRLHTLHPDSSDFHFVQTLYNFAPIPNYEIADITLVADESDEQAFTAGIDLLEKKHGNSAHNARWKTESLQTVPQRKAIRTQLKSQRYRSEYVPHVKLLPLWQGTSVDQVKNLGETGFNDLTKTSEQHLGKGYYGTDNASLAYSRAKQKYGEPKTLLALSWYAGKVVYPVVTGDENKLNGKPHFANHDLHFAAMTHAGTSSYIVKPGEPVTHHDTVVFDSSQVLPRYLVSLKQKGSPSTTIMQELLKVSYRDPGSRSLLFQPNFSYNTTLLHKKSLEEVQRQRTNLMGMQAGRISSTQNFPIDPLITNFLQDSTKEVLVLTTDSREDLIILGRYLERVYWNNYKDGQAIPLYISLPQISDVNGDLVVQALVFKGLSEQAISDLKTYRKFNLILAGYDEIHKKIPLIKNNHFNRQGGFRGKLIVTCLSSTNSEDFLFYTEGGTLEQQAKRLLRQALPRFSTEECQRQLDVITNLNFDKAQLPSEKYAIAKTEYQQNYDVCLQHKIKLLLPPVGGELKPWEYDNALRYSPNWIDKGAYRLHELSDLTPDYAFVAAMYQQSLMPGYELDQVYLVSDQVAEQAFTAHLALLDRRKDNPEYTPHWQQEHNPSLRQQALQQFEQKTYKTLLAHSVNLLPMWHGTGPAAAGGIATSGFASLATVDCGFFGKGLYGSSSAEYSYRVYAKGYHGEDGLLLLNWYSAQNVYPTIDGDMLKIQGQANYQNYDSHFIPVAPRNPNNPDEVNYLPIKNGQTSTYEEFVTFPTAQVLPRYILSLRDSITKQRLPGMAKFLATPKIESTQRNTLHQMGLSQTIAALKHSAYDEIEQDFMLIQGFSSLYIPAQGTSSDKLDDVKPEQIYTLADKAQEFLRTSDKEVWLLQGNSGSGKSLFGRHLERYLWDTYQEGHIIPIFIPLPRINNPGDDLIKKVLELKGLPLNAIAELKAKKQFLFILDGYDEIYSKPKLIQLYKFNELGSWQGKIIVSSRAQHLSSSEDNLLYPNHPGEDLIKSISRFDKSFIMPFTEEQTGRYIHEYCKSAFNKVRWTPNDYQQSLERFTEIKTFLKEPFLLFLVLNALPSLKQQTTTNVVIKKIDLYQAFTSSWFKSQFERMIQHNFDLTKYLHPESEILTLFENYAKDLAFEMFLKDTQVIRKEGFDSKFNKIFAGEDAILAFQGCPLRRIGESYLFIHKSFQEYFVAKKILDELIEDTLPIEVLSIQQKLLTATPEIIDFLVDYLTPLNSKASQRSQAKLLSLAISGRQIRKLNQLAGAANALTILNAARLSFSGMDFSMINLKGANLSGGIIDHTNFTGTDLSLVNFHGAWLRQSNFTNADFTGASFGELANLEHSLEYISCCSISLDGRYLALAGKKLQEATHIIVLYNAVNLEPIKQLTEQESPINCLVFDGSSSFFSAGSQAGVVCIWDLTTYEPKKFKTGYGVTNIVFNNNPESLMLAAGGYDGSINIWNVATLKCEKKLKRIQEISGLCIAPNGTSLISGSSDGSIRLWDLANHELEPKKTLNISKKPITSIVLIPGSLLIAVGSADSNIYICDLMTFQIKHKLEGHTDKIRSLVFNHVGSLLASSSYDCTVRIWDMENLSCKHVLARGATINSLSFNATDSLLISSSKDEVRFWDIERLSRYKKSNDGHSCSITSIAIHDSLAVSGGNDRTICLWDLSNQSLKFKSLNCLAREITGIAFNAAGNKLAICSLDDKIWLFDLATKTSKYVYTTGGANSIAFNTAGNLLVVGGNYDGNISFWDVTSQDIEPQFINSIKGHKAKVINLKFNPVFLILASGSHDGTICLWDTNTFSCLKVLVNANNIGVTSIIFNVEGAILISGDKDGAISLWDVKTFNLIQRFKAHNKSITDLTINSNGLLATSSEDGSIKIWNIIDTIANLTTIENNFLTYSIAWYLSPNNIDTFLVAGDSDRQIRMWYYIPTQNTLTLFWISAQNVLNATGADLHGARMSSPNFKLLTQRQAIGQARIIELETPESLYEAANEQLKQKEFIKAFELFSLSAAKNYPKAKTSLGTFFAEPSHTGYVVTEDNNKAMELFAEAAAAGHDRAQKNLEYLTHKLKH